MLIAEAAAVHDHCLGNRNTGGLGDMLCLGLVHGQRRGKNARMGIGNFEIFEDSLNRSVFAEWSVKRVEDHIRAQFLKHRRDVVTDIDARDAIAFAFQSIRASRPRRQAHRPLRGKSAQQDSDMLAAHSNPQTIRHYREACLHLADSEIAIREIAA